MAVGLRLERDQAYEPDADPAVLSQHFALAGDHVRAHRYAMVAARRATERFSHADAAQLYRRAIDAGRAYGLAADSRALAEAWEQLGEALRCMGEPEAAAQALTEARRLLSDDPIAQARICHSHAQGRRAQHVADGRRPLAAARASMRGRARRRRCGGVPGADPVAPRRDPQPPGPMGGGDLDVPPGDRRSRGGRRAECAGARVLCARLGAGRVRPARAGHSLLAGARALSSSSAIPSTSPPF